MGFELTISVVKGTDCIGSCKANYHMITATTAPYNTWSEHANHHTAKAVYMMVIGHEEHIIISCSARHWVLTYLGKNTGFLASWFFRVRVRPWVITYLGKNTGFLASWSFKSSDTVSSLATYFSTYADHLSTSTGSSDCSCSVSNNSNVSLQSRLNWKKKKYILLGNFSF